VSAVRRQLSAVDGVRRVEIDFPTKTAMVEVDPGTSPETVTGGLSGRYSATVKTN
jgi:copper chaperone CopZ